MALDNLCYPQPLKSATGLSANQSKKFAMLHLDPARPRNSRTHGLDEMAPYPEYKEAWKDKLNHGERGPAILLDLSRDWMTVNASK